MTKRTSPVVRVRPSLGDSSASLLGEWHPSRNGDQRPEHLRASSSERVWWRCAVDHEWQASVSSRTRGARCPFCVGRRASAERNLLVCFPDIAAEWHPALNDPVTPDEVMPGSGRVAWWLGSCGHQWQMPVSTRTRRRGRCPACTTVRSAAPGTGSGAGPHRSLRKQFPFLAAEWHPTRNDPPTRSDLMAKGSTAVWWSCRGCGAEWRATVTERSAGLGCPDCGDPRHRRLTTIIAAALGEVLVVGGRADLPRPLRGWRAAEPDVVLPELRLAVDVHDQADDASRLPSRVRDDPHRLAVLTHAPWALARVRDQPAPATARAVHDLVVADLEDTTAVISALDRGGLLTTRTPSEHRQVNIRRHP